MEKTIKIDGKQYHLVYKGKTERIYREQFHSDLTADIAEMQWTQNQIMEQAKKELPNADNEMIGILLTRNMPSETLERVMWASIKASNKNKKVKPFESFVDDIENYMSFRQEAMTWVYNILIGSEPIVDIDGKETSSEEEKDTKKPS